MVPEDLQSRRRFLTVTAVGIASSVVGCVSQTQRAPAGAEKPTATETATPTPEPRVPYFDGWLADVDNYDYELADRRGEQSVTVTVGASGNGGNFAFAPTAIQVDPGTTVQWQWAGNGGAHNVVAATGQFESGSPVAEAGVHFEHTFEDTGVFRYHCQPHRSLGMKGVVVVGDDYPTAPRSEVVTPTETPDQDHDTDPTATPTGPYGGYLTDVSGFDGTATDWTGQSQVTVAVGAAGNGGNFAFAPTAIQIDPGTTVRWRWTGDGGAHNVVAESGRFDSGEVRADAGVHYEYTFETAGVSRYYCAPHKALGMKGVVEVVTD